MAYWQTVQFPGWRLRVARYLKGYKADHWCEKGHIVYCLEGEFVSELAEGSSFSQAKGMSYIVSDGLNSHRSGTHDGVTLLIIDGDFLKLQPTSLKIVYSLNPLFESLGRTVVLRSRILAGKVNFINHIFRY